MPFTYTCSEHGNIGENVTDVIDHARKDHPGRMVADMTGNGTIRSSYVSQAVAQGNGLRHVSACRRCARPAHGQTLCAQCEGEST